MSMKHIYGTGRTKTLKGKKQNPAGTKIAKDKARHKIGIIHKHGLIGAYFAEKKRKEYCETNGLAYNSAGF